jgi:hypothetical protein
MREHDVIGCGWERLDPTEIEDNSRVTGRVYFTRNGKRLAEVLDGVSAGLFPVVHIQKKVSTNVFTDLYGTNRVSLV